MRTFIAINFDDEFKQKLIGICERMKPYVQSGRFTHKDNLHMTLVFLGEIPYSLISSLTEALASVKSAPFQLKTSELGYFHQSRGDLYWLRLEKSLPLFELNRNILSALNKRKTETGVDFHPDAKAFKPHLTLGRELNMDKSFNLKEFSGSIENITANIESFELMNSELLGGKRVYTELYSVQFG